MFTKKEAMLFVLEGGFRHANLVYIVGDRYQVWSDRGGRYAYKSPDFPEPGLFDSEFAEGLGGRGDGWFVSALRDDEWRWHFSPKDSANPRTTFNFGKWFRKTILRLNV